MINYLRRMKMTIVMEMLMPKGSGFWDVIIL